MNCGLGLGADLPILFCQSHQVVHDVVYSSHEQIIQGPKEQNNSLVLSFFNQSCVNCAHLEQGVRYDSACFALTKAMLGRRGVKRTTPFPVQQQGLPFNAEVLLYMLFQTVCATHTVCLVFSGAQTVSLPTTVCLATWQVSTLRVLRSSEEPDAVMVPWHLKSGE